MKSVIDHEHTLVIKNSKFICLLFQINTQEEITFFLNETKKKYPNATHYCYAYILEQNQKESDDGEPSGTAGKPILQVLEKNHLNHVLCIVVRYFGKIKLGAGGLVRAYTKSVVECLKDHITVLEKGYQIILTFSYELLKTIDYLLTSNKIIEKNFNEKIMYRLFVNETLLETLQNIPNVNVLIQKEGYFIKNSQK